MKKSKFNIFRKINNDEQVIFNSFSLALAKVNKGFSRFYDEIEKIDANNLNKQQKEFYDSMLDANFIISNNTDEIKDLEFLRLRAIADTNAFGLVIYPTLACNFDCYYCYQKNKTGILKKKAQEKILELIKHHSEKKTNISVEWFGGEVLLAFDIVSDMSQKIINICKKNKVKYYTSMVSNGYLFTDDIIKKMKSYKIEKVQVTLDGPPAIHNKRRILKNTKEGTFDEIIKNIKKLKKNNIRVSIRVNVNKDFNIDSLLQLTKILEKNGLIKNNFYIAQECDSDSRNKSCMNEGCLSDEGFAKLNLEFCKKLHNLGLKELYEHYYPKVSFNFCETTRFNSISIDPEGYLYKCRKDVGMPEKAVGNILDNNTYNEIFFNNNVKYMTWNPFKYKKCLECNILPICSGNCPELGIANGEPQCIEWKYNIEDLIDAIALFKMK